MRYNVLAIFTFCLVFSCSEKDSDPEKTKPSLSCDVFSSVDIEVTEVNEEGVTLEIDLSKYHFSPATHTIRLSYKIQNDPNVFYKLVEAEASGQPLTISINENLVDGYVYELKAVLAANGNECSSKTVIFESQGSLGLVEKEPITCAFLFTLKPELTHIEGTTATASLPLSPFTSFENVQGYGFMIRPRGYNNLTVINLPGSPTPSNFKSTIDLDVVCGVIYDIRAFITINSTTCYSEPIGFTPEISSVVSPWCAKYNTENSGFDVSFGININRKPYFIFQGYTFYEIDTTTSAIIPRKNFPLYGDTGVNFSIFTIGKSGYFKSSSTNDLYKYDSDTDNWTNLGNSQLTTNRYFFGGQLSEVGYIFSHYAAYRYDVTTNTFNKLADNTENVFIQTFQTKEAIYAITSAYDILIFNASTGKWSKVTSYPGNKSEWVVALVNGNKAYIGLSHRFLAPDQISYYDMYELDLVTYQWRQLADFPFKYRNSYNIMSVNAALTSYAVYKDAGATVWRFDPTHVVYK